MACVLVVDDELGIRLSLERILGKDGHDVRTAADVTEALPQLETGEIDLVIADLIMPNGSGMDLLHNIKDNYPELPVIIITGHPNIDVVLNSVQAGAYTFLAKPVKPDELKAAVKDAYNLSILSRQSVQYQQLLEQRVESQTRKLRAFNRRLRRIAEVTRDFSHAEDLETLASRVLTLFGDILEVEGGSFYLIQGDELVLIRSLDPGHQQRSISVPPSPKSVLGRVFFLREALLVEDIDKDPDLRSSGWTGYTNGSFVAFPMQDDMAEIIGVVTFHNRVGRPFNKQDVDLGSVIISHATAAVKSVMLARSLKASECNYRQLIEFAFSGVAVVRNENLIYVNTRLADMLGYEVDGLIGLHYLDIVAESDRKRVHEFSRGRAEGIDTPNQYSLRCKHRDGSVLWMEVQASRVEFEGQPALLGHFTDITDRVLIEERLADSERRFRLLFEKSADGIAYTDIDLNITGSNDAFQRMVGYSSDELAGMNVAELTPADHMEKEYELIQSTGAGNSSTERFQKEYIRKDGSHVPIELDIYLMRDQDGKPVGYWAYVRDITERLRAEQAVKDSERLYRGISDEALTGIIIHRRGYLLYLNPKMMRMLGFQPEDREMLLGTTILNHIHPDDNARVMNWVAAWEAGNKAPDHFELRLMRRDRSVIWTETVATTVYHDDKPAVLAHLMDITERKKAEMALRESEQRFSRFVERAPMGMIIVDENGHIEYMNRKFTRDYGYNLKDIPTLEIWLTRAVPEGDYRRQMVESVFNDEGANGSDDRMDQSWVLLAADGSTHYAELMVTDVAQRRMILLRDVTERVQSEKERDALENQLMHAQKMEAVGRLAGGIAHDFNNLLTGISGNIQLAMMEIEKNSIVYGMLENISKAATRTGELTRQLLAFSRKQTISPRELDLNRVLRDMENMLNGLIGEDISLVFDLEVELGNVNLDPAQMEQAIMNLILNARDAMPTGGTLRLATSNVVFGPHDAHAQSGLKPGEYVALEVQDSGTGIASDLLGSIFEPFFTTKEAGKGTGLGLAMVYGIVKQQGGAIGVESKLGKGTTFTLYFPKIDAEPLIDPPPSEKEQEVRKGTETILVVEDEPMVRQIAVQMLRRLGYHTLEAENGRVALNVCDDYNDHIDLLLTDVVMPEMNGREVAEILKVRRPDIQILYTSGYADQVIGDHGILGKEVEFIPKPYSFRQLAERVRHILDGR